TPWDISMASLHTANASVPRQCLQEVGAFDDGYDAYGWEDLDLGRRLRKAGFTRLEAKDAVAYHVDPPITTQTQLQARLAKERERGRTALRFLENHREFSARLTAQDTAFTRSSIGSCGSVASLERTMSWPGRNGDRKSVV